ncbi:hypothetical protein EDB84DRAFT_1444570 [Lactarius hengduanensis]|nr:hypothetical protein EDB84DRAFT_1444570 [Lactarius hengduanensis]
MITQRAVISSVSTARLVGFLFRASGPPSALKPGNSKTPTLAHISVYVNDRHRYYFHDVSATWPKIYMPWPSVREEIGTVYANFGDEMSVPLVAGCDIFIWRARLGEGESSERVAAGPGGEGDNVPRSFFAHAHSPGVLTAPRTEFVPTLGGSGGDAITHVMHHLRERVGPGDSTNLTHTNGALLLVRIIPSLVRYFLPSGVIWPMRSRGAFDFLKIHLKYRTQLQSAAERSKQFVARVAKCLKSQTLGMCPPGLPAGAYKWHFDSRSHDSARTPSLLQRPRPSGVLRDMRCTGTLARIGLLMVHRTVVMNEGRDTDNVFVNGQVG